MDTTLMILSAIVAIIVASIIRSSIRPKNFPPGPISLPFVGYIPFLEVRNLGRSFKKLSKRYGDIFSIYLGTRRVVVLNSYPLIKEAFSKKEFSGRPNMFSGTFFQKGKTGVSTTEGEHWERQRDFFHKHLGELVNGTGAKGFHEVIMDEILDMKREFAAKVGEPTCPTYQINVGIINMLWTLASGRRLHSQQQEFLSVYECIDKITQFMSRAAIMSFMPFLATLLPESISKMERGRYYRDRFVAISEKWISEHKEEYRGNRGGDLQDAYLEKVKQNEPSFTESGLGAMLREMFVIGAESESVLLRWSVRILSIYTDVQRKIQDEIDRVVGAEDNVTWEDRFRLPYTRAALAEIQRFADITPSGGVGHKVLCDVEFHGYILPKGTGVVANFNACHRNPAYWKHPDKFYPEHFLTEDGRFAEDREGFLPFGLGLRRCPGEDLAQLEMFLIITNLIKDFHFSVPEGESSDLGTQYKSGTGFIRNPKPFRVVLQTRN